MKKLLFALPLFLTACHIPTHLQGGEGVAIVEESETAGCVYVGEVSGFSLDETKSSSEDQMKTSAMNSLRNTAALREANAVVIKKQESRRGENSAMWRYNISGVAYICN